MKNFEGSALNRFLNVLSVIAYFFVALIIVLAVYIAFSSRPIISATVQCKDNTKWSATKIYDDSYALCGICTQRNSDGSKYSNCDYSNMDYYSYEVIEKQYSWSWNIIIYPVIVFLIGFGFIDLVRIGLVYIFSGKLVWDKSIVLKIASALYK